MFFALPFPIGPMSHLLHRMGGSNLISASQQLWRKTELGAVTSCSFVLFEHFYEGRIRTHTGSDQISLLTSNVFYSSHKEVPVEE